MTTATEPARRGAAVRAEGLEVRFANGTYALRGIDLTIDPGAFVAVVGRSGAGKSTFLRTINRLVEPTAGRVWVGETDVTAVHRRRLHRLRRRVGFVFQQFHLVRSFSALDNVLAGRIAFNPWWRNMLRAYTPDEVETGLAYLRRVGMERLAHQRADTLSGGQQQRVAIARAAAQEPEVLLADEPTASLDPRLARVILDLLRDFNTSGGVTVIANLHDVKLARMYASRIIGFADGRVVFDGPPAAFGEADEEALYGAEGTDAL